MSDDLEDTAFNKALARFRASLTKDQREQFVGCDKREVEKTIAEIQKKHGAQRRQKNMRRISKFLEGMSQLGQVVEVFLNADISVAFIWGPIKFLLQVFPLALASREIRAYKIEQTASTWIETLDMLLEKYAEIGETLPGLSQYGALFSRYPSVGKQLENYYCDVLEFNKIALDVFSRPAWKTIFHSTWKTFKTNFGPILANFKLHQRLLSEEKLTALMSEMQGLTGSTRDQFQRLQDELSRMDERNRAKIRAETDERQREQRRKLRDELSAPDHVQDQEDSFSILRENSSTDWITKEPLFKSWSDLSDTQSPFIFLSGIPGAGKTTLTSGVVNHLLELRKTTTTGRSTPSVAYFYFKYMSDDKRDLQGMMRSILLQLVEQDPSLLDFVYKETCDGSSLSLGRLKELTETAIHSQQLCFLVVDGLDESVRYEASKKSEAVKVLEWLRDLDASSLSAQASLRVFISGQRDEVSETMLKQYPTLQLEKMRSHKIDIERYSRLKAQEICQKFSDGDVTIASEIFEKVTAASKGMFLYAKVVLDNLLEQMTVKDFQTEMRDGNFPKELEQAYARVVERVLRTPEEKKRNIAEKILGWVICAHKPLRWREIQSLFCIDSEAGTADMSDRPLKSCKFFCSSLIEITGCHNDVDDNEGRVELVHISAKQYLIHFQFICLASEHVKMALFSCRYLASEPFDLQDSDKMQACALNGYYNLHDYAVKSWWHHTNESLKCASLSSLAEILSEMVVHLSRHLKKYFTAHDVDNDMIVSSSEHILAEFHKLPTDDHRAREKSGSLERRTIAIREILETLWKRNSHVDAEYTIGLRLYGPMQYKCPHSWCQRFEDGFLQRTERDDHVNQHLRPFSCKVEGCYATNLGFSSPLQLQKHNTRHHQEPEQPRFSIPKKTKSYNNVWAAIADGAVDAVDAIVQKQIASSGSFDFEQVERRGLLRGTPLEYAAACEEYGICKYLLSKGASAVGVGQSSALKHALKGKDADIISLLISHYQPTDLRTMMQDKRRSLLEYADAEALNIFMDTLRIYHPGYELPDSWLMHALMFDQPNGIGFYFSHQDGIDGNKTILHLLRKSYDECMNCIMSTSERCFQTLLSHETEELAVKQILFEACAQRNQMILSNLPSITVELSEWLEVKKHLSSLKQSQDPMRKSHPLVRVIEQLKPRNVWSILGRPSRVLLEPWIQGLSRTALQEIIRADNVFLFKKSEDGATFLHGCIWADNLDVVQLILSMEEVDVNAAALIPWDLFSKPHQSELYPMYRPEQMQDQETLSKVEKKEHEQNLRDLWKSLSEHPPNSAAHETAKTQITELSLTVWKEETSARYPYFGDLTHTPIRLALVPPTWNGIAIFHALLNTGRVDISCHSVTDELIILVAAARTRDNIVMRGLIQNGHSKLCSTATKGEADRLMQHLPHHATDLLIASTYESGAEVVSREMSRIKQHEGVEEYPLIDSLVEHRDFSIVRELILRKSDICTIDSAKQEALFGYAAETADHVLLQKLNAICQP